MKQVGVPVKGSAAVPTSTFVTLVEKNMAYLPGINFSQITVPELWPIGALTDMGTSDPKESAQLPLPSRH